MLDLRRCTQELLKIKQALEEKAEKKSTGRGLKKLAQVVCDFLQQAGEVKTSL